VSRGAVELAADSARGAAPRVVVGSEGLAGTWRVVRNRSQTSAQTAAQLSVFCDVAPPTCPAPELLISDDGVLRLDALSSAPASVLLALRIVVSGTTPTRAHVFVGGSGSFAILLDGRELARGAAPLLRADELHAQLELTPGAHLLVLRAERPASDAWQLQARLLDAEFGAGLGAGVALSLGGIDDALAASAAVRAVRVRESRAVALDGALQIDVALELPAGGVARPITAALAGESRALQPEARVAAAPQTLRIAAPARGELRAAMTLSAGASGARSVPVGVGLALDRPVAAAIHVLRGLLGESRDASASAIAAATRVPLAWRLDELERVLRERDPDVLWRRTLVSEVRRVIAELGRGRDPLAAPVGYTRMAIRSRLDGALVPYELFVPTEHARGTRRYPLLITLHGFTGNAGDYFRNTFGMPREPHLSLEEHGRHGAAPTSAPMIVVAPTGRGQTHYRYAGEEDVLEVLADVRARYRVDDARIHVTGGSMGGTGAAYLPFRHPDLFAASAALAGYHDQRVRQDTAQDALAPWERFLRAERSDVDWAENALHLSMLLVRGTRDRPLAWTTSLATRLGVLRYSFEHREPGSGHNVWTETYAAGALFRWLAPHRRPAAPAHVRFRTARARHASAWWVQAVQRAQPDAFADIDATLQTERNAHRVRGTTQNVARVLLAPGVAGERVRAELDGEVVDGASPLTLLRVDGHWRAALASDLPLRELGPIRDVFHDPLLFVVGTGDPRHTLINRLVARAWAEPRGWQVRYPIVDDVAVTDAQLRAHTLVLVGPPRSNGVLARLTAHSGSGAVQSAQLPVRFEEGALSVGQTVFRGDELGTVFVARNTLVPTTPSSGTPSSGTPTSGTPTSGTPTSPIPSRVLVIAGVTPLGTWRSTFLPDLLPDLVIFDAQIAAARDRFAAGGTGATFREALFYPLVAPTTGGSSRRSPTAPTRP